MSDFQVRDGNIDGAGDQLKQAASYVVKAQDQIEKGFSGDDALKLGNANSLLAIGTLLYLLVRIEHTRDVKGTEYRSPYYFGSEEN